MANRHLAHSGEALTEAAERMRKAREHTREIVERGLDENALAALMNLNERVKRLEAMNKALVEEAARQLGKR